MRLNYTSTSNNVVLENREGENAPVSLGNITNHVSLLGERQNRRVLRYAIQQGISEMLQGERVSTCMRSIVPTKNTVKVMYSEQRKGHYGNLMVCGSVWACPICSVRITEKRRVELAAGLAGWQGGVLLGAFTLQHKRNDKLADLRKLLADTFRAMQQGKEWLAIKNRYGIVGTLTSTELTWGEGNGWHVHKHGLWFTRKEVAPAELVEIEKVISKRFRAILSKRGGFSNPDFGVKFAVGTDQAGAVDYAMKWGIDAEMTKGLTKQGRDGNLTPFEIASWALVNMDLNSKPVRLFREYYWSFKGTYQMKYSRGLRALLALGAEKSDAEIAKEQDEDAVLLAELGREAWKLVCAKNLRGELIRVADTGDAIQVAEFLQGLGIYC